jgi:hypothetical protein
VFFIGVVLWARGRIEEIYIDTTDPKILVKRLEKRADKLEREIRNEYDEQKKRMLYKELKDIRDKIEIIKLSKPLAEKQT